jgi:hypothetical protein
MGVGRVMVIRLVIEIGEIYKGGTVRRVGKRGEKVGEVVWGLLGFLALLCVWIYLCCCTVGCLCQGLQGVGVI